jgi:hypothetical protein
MKPTRAAAPLAALAALLAGALPFAVGTTAWPEIVAPAWFVTQGVRLYDGILFPHTPLLILLTALAGKTLGFTAATLRALPALALAASAASIVLGMRPRPASRLGPAAGLLLGTPLLALLTVYTEGPALWPEPFLAPFALAGVLLLERYERAGDGRALAAAGLAFGAGVLVKQTFGWAAVAALLWLVVRSRRRRAGATAVFAAAVALPYLGFALSWALAFRTLAHVRWTLVYPVFSQMSKEIAVPLAAADVHEALLLLVPFAALALGVAALPATSRRRSPLFAVALGATGMAWPRPGLLHLSALTGLAALAAARSALVLPAAFRHLRRRRSFPARLVALAGGAAGLAVTLGVAALGAGPLLLDRLGGPVFYWDDTVTRAETASVRARVAPGGELLVFGARQTLYPLTLTRTPGGFYVNPFFWYCLNRDGGDERLVAALSARPGLPILFRAPSSGEEPVRATRVFAFLEASTEPDGPGPGETAWRRVAGVR